MPRRKTQITRRVPISGRARRARRHRNAAVLRLWRRGWTGTRIAEHLGIKPWIVNNVVHKHHAARRPRAVCVVETVSLADAAVDDGQQVMWPVWERLADLVRVVDAYRRGMVIKCWRLGARHVFHPRPAHAGEVT